MGVRIKDEVWSEERLEWRLCSSMYSGERSMARGAHARLLKESGDYFSRGKDELANAFRAFAETWRKEVVIPIEKQCDDWEKQMPKDEQT